MTALAEVGALSKTIICTFWFTWVFPGLLSPAMALCFAARFLAAEEFSEMELRTAVIAVGIPFIYRSLVT